MGAPKVLVHASISMMNFLITFAILIVLQFVNLMSVNVQDLSTQIVQLLEVVFHKHTMLMDSNAQVFVRDTAYQVKYSAMQNLMKTVAKEKTIAIQKLSTLRDVFAQLNAKLIANRMKFDVTLNFPMDVPNVIIVFLLNTRMVLGKYVPVFVK